MSLYQISPRNVFIFVKRNVFFVFVDQIRDSSIALPKTMQISKFEFLPRDLQNHML